uniref:Uncharacterized protein n=1 Tax=Oryza nivara TaxID=4536 RepID=A0A0E0HFC4_ORYNI
MFPRILPPNQRSRRPYPPTPSRSNYPLRGYALHPRLSALPASARPLAFRRILAALPLARSPSPSSSTS